jgi:UDP-GlcNAc:undecaprenyl-phosphate/decaprenyl-phosphate GlcNAc-1-phosphate transferase
MSPNKLDGTNAIMVTDARPYLVMAAASLVCVVATQWVRRWAPYWGLVDHPDGFRKLHGSAIPLGGGVAVFIGTMLGIVVSVLCGLDWMRTSSEDAEFLFRYAIGASLICGLGVIDDRFSLRGRQKLLGQIVAVTILTVGGLEIRSLEILGYRIDLGIFAIPFTVFWLLGAINALNLIDGVDGLATTVGIILSITISILAALTGHALEAHLAAIFAASLLGFLVFNWPPAKIFLGDAGSMLIGFTLGALAIRASVKGAATAALVAPTVMWAIPIFDVSMAILRRKLTGQSLYATDRGHLHHVLQRNGWGRLGTVLVIGTLSAICGAASMIAVVFKSELTAVVTAAAVLSTLIVTRLFGHSEVQLLLNRVQGFLTSLVRRHPAQFVPSPVEQRFHGTREWKQLCQLLTASAERCGLMRVQVNINAPMVGERYHAEWRRPTSGSEDQRWKSEIPLKIGSRVVGRVTMEGVLPEDESTFHGVAERLIDLQLLEHEIIDLLTTDNAMPETVPNGAVPGSASPGGRVALGAVETVTATNSVTSPDSASPFVETAPVQG